VSTGNTKKGRGREVTAPCVSRQALDERRARGQIDEKKRVTHKKKGREERQPQSVPKNPRKQTKGEKREHASPATNR